MYCTLNLTLELNITEEQLDDIVDTASYDIGYWASFIGYDEGKYNIVEIDDDKSHVLSHEDVINAIIKYINDYDSAKTILDLSNNTIDTELVDGEAADIIMQYACFGELIYG